MRLQLEIDLPTTVGHYKLQSSKISLRRDITSQRLNQPCRHCGTSLFVQDRSTKAILDVSSHFWQFSSLGTYLRVKSSHSRMASMGGGQLDSAPLVNQIRAGRYVNKTLQEICAADSLPKGGNKAELQKRIIDRESSRLHLLPPTRRACSHSTRRTVVLMNALSRNNRILPGEQRREIQQVKRSHTTSQIGEFESRLQLRCQCLFLPSSKLQLPPRIEFHES